jgi:uncharacterized lipoprotein YmbA
MTTTYQWTIQAMDCVPQEDGHTDVVVTAHWIVNATDGTYNASVYGTQSFTYDATKAFTPYEDLTQDQVVGWVQEGMGIDAVTALQENLDQQIANQINPPIVTPPLPWAPAPTPPEPVV